MNEKEKKLLILMLWEYWSVDNNPECAYATKLFCEELGILHLAERYCGFTEYAMQLNKNEIDILKKEIKSRLFYIDVED